MRRLERRRQWAGRIEEWESSELTQRAYCKLQAISYETFKGWQQRLRQGSNKSVEPARFVPVRVLDTRLGEVEPGRLIRLLEVLPC